MQAFDTQAAALAEIVAKGNAYYRGGWLGLEIRPRWHCLLIGPTGVGKSAVAGQAATALSAKCVRVSCPGYMPSGAHNRAVSETISTITEAVARNSRTLLAFDELEKLFPASGGAGGNGGSSSETSSWGRHILGELFELLDGRFPQGIQSPGSDEDDEDPHWLDRLTTKLQTSVFIIGIGTFQSFFDGSKNRRSIGFGAEINPEIEEISAEDIVARLPRELLNRFGTIVRLPELRADDYRSIARQAEDTLPKQLRQAFRAAADRRIAAAINAKKGVRFVEESLMDVLTNHPLEPATEPAPAPKPDPESEEIDLC